ncbi:MAG: hypothetical protein EON52_11665, partial [Actinomycetales bacterium]
AAQAASSNASSASYWLSQQLTNGIASYKYEYDGEVYSTDDVGLTIDVLQAFVDTDTQTAKQQTILDALEDRVDSYTSAGGTGKLITAVQGAGEEPRLFGGVNLVERLEDKLVTSGAEAGRAVDSPDYSSTLTQALAVRGLSVANSTDEAASATSYLLKQQCADGGFRESMFAEATPDTNPSDGFDDSVSAVDRTCGDSATSGDDKETVDTTAIAIQALLEANISAEVPGTVERAEKAADYLLKQQTTAGSFRNDGKSNANSTGLAAAALWATGHEAAADRAAAWLVKRQVTKASSVGTQLTGELGAVAFNDEALANAKLDGIEDLDRGQFIRATSQALAGLDKLLGAKTLKVTPKYASRPRSAQQLVTVTGLKAGEQVTVYTLGKTLKGTASSTGSWSVRFTVGTSLGKKVVRAFGQNAKRVGESSFTVVK